MTVTPVPSDNRSFIVRLTQLVWLLFGVLEALIGLRVVLKLIAANPNSPFAVLVYRLSGLFVWPFNGLTRTPAADGMVLDIPSIIAMLVYALVAWVIVRLIWIVLDRPGEAAVVSQTTVVRESTPLALHHSDDDHQQQREPRPIERRAADAFSDT